MTSVEARKSVTRPNVGDQAFHRDHSMCQDNVETAKKPQHEMLGGNFPLPKNDNLRGIEALSSSSSGSWMQRIGWFKNRKSRDDFDGVFNEHHDSPKAVYHGGVMESGYSSKSVDATPEIGQNRSHVTHSSQATKDSVYDFHESEWTPPDSSYGAAIPVAGCIPKNIRRAIEVTLIGLGVIGLAFLIVTTSIRVSEEVSKNRDVVDSNSEFDGGTGLDDDLNTEAATQLDDYFDDTFARIDGNNGNYDDYFYSQNGYSNSNDDAKDVTYDDYSQKGDDYYYYHGNRRR